MYDQSKLLRINAQLAAHYADANDAAKRTNLLIEERDYWKNELQKLDHYKFDEARDRRCRDNIARAEASIKQDRAEREQRAAVAAQVGRLRNNLVDFVKAHRWPLPMGMK